MAATPPLIPTTPSSKETSQYHLPSKQNLVEEHLEEGKIESFQNYAQRKRARKRIEYQLDQGEQQFSTQIKSGNSQFLPVLFTPHRSAFPQNSPFKLPNDTWPRSINSQQESSNTNSQGLSFTSPERDPYLLRSKSRNIGEKKEHTYISAQELYLAEQLKDSESPLYGPNEKNQHPYFYTHKKIVYEKLAEKFNARFSSEIELLNLDGAQIKNKIESMKTQWGVAKAFHDLYSNNNLKVNNLRERIKDICCFFYVLQEITPTSCSSNPRVAGRSTETLARPLTRDPDSDAGSEGDELIVEQNDTSLELEKSPPANRMKKSARNRDVDMQSLLENRSKATEETNDLKRQKLEMDKKRLKMDERRLAMDERRFELELRLKEVQIRKIEWDIEMTGGQRRNSRNKKSFSR